MGRFMIAAAHKSSGKTVVSTGIAAALATRGLKVAPFKKGPDYIDPMWLALAAGRPAYNLDFNTMTHHEILGLFASRSQGVDVSLIEANKGLFDGVETDGSDSNAALAKLLDAPIVLVVDTKGMTRGIAPLLLGYQAFDRDLHIGGVILNKTGGLRHETKLRQAVEAYTDLPVLGSIGVSEELDISERHLGLTTPAEISGNAGLVRELGERIGRGVDLDRILDLARSAKRLENVGKTYGKVYGSPPGGTGLRIGIARDEAFGFYYADDLEAFAEAGAQLVPVDMIRDAALPPVDALFIGGGFPETRMRELSANAGMRESVRAALEAGLPCYAECGGLMYLCRSLSWHGETVPMVGFFEADAVMHPRPQGRGYVRFAPEMTGLWPAPGGEWKAHEFHYASLENLSDPVFGRRITRGHGIDGEHDALVRANTEAGFIHLRHTAATPWVTEFLRFASSVRTAKQNPARSGRG